MLRLLSAPYAGAKGESATRSKHGNANTGIIKRSTTAKQDQEKAMADAHASSKDHAFCVASMGQRQKRCAALVLFES